MKVDEAIDYIAVHGGYNEDAPLECAYSVRFPTQYGKLITASDTLELRDKVLSAARKLPKIKIPALRKEIEFCTKRLEIALAEYEEE